MTTELSAGHRWHQENLSICWGMKMSTMLLAMRLKDGEAKGFIADIGFDSLRSYVSELPIEADSRTSIYRALRVSEEVVPLVALPEAGVSTEDVVAAGPRKLDMCLGMMRDLSPRQAGEWVHKAATLSVADLQKELMEARGIDMSEAWRDSTEYLARELRRQAYRLEQAAGREEALGILDSMTAETMQCRARIERQ